MVVLIPAISSTHFDWFHCLQTISVVAWCQAHNRLMVAPQLTEYSLLAAKILLAPNSPEQHGLKSHFLVVSEVCCEPMQRKPSHSAPFPLEFTDGGR